MNIYGILVVLHLLGSCVWVGGHVLLAFSLPRAALDGREADALFRIESLYDRVGMPAFFLQLMSGLLLAYLHFPEMAAWFQFELPIGKLIGIKIGLMGLTLLLALHLRLRCFPKVATAGLASLRLPVALIVFVSCLLVFVGASFRIGWLY